MSKKIVQTAGRDILGDFAPQFAHYNDDVLFGENWNDENIDPKTKSIVVLSVFMGRGLITDALKHHLQYAKDNGVTKKEIVGIITHAAFYAGWPVAWAVFNLAKDVWTEDEEDAHGGFFGLGKPNDAYAQYFVGQSYLNSELTGPNDPIAIHNVTFEPGCRNNWHIHHASQGGGQILICVDGEGWYQEEGKPAQSLKPGDIVEIPAGVKHWHGAKQDSWFSHLAFAVPGEDTFNEWLEPVSDEEYNQLEY